MAGFRSKRIAARERYADAETLDHVIDLRKRLSDAEMQRDNALNVVMALRRENMSLIKMVDHVVKERGDQ